MRLPSLFKPKVYRWLTGLVFCMFLPVLAYGVDGGFELDANAVDSNNAAAPDDWNNITSSLKTGILADPAPLTIFTTGGSKDIRDVSQWRHTTGSVPDKDDITNAYAAAYEIAGDLVIYFGADRLANNGDAEIGFWFFQNGVKTNNDGTFSGSHAVGDILVISDFSNGGDISTIKVLEWVGGKNGDSDGDGRLDGPLQLIDSGDGNVTGGNIFCTSSDLACAIVNSSDAPAPWPYTPKFGTSGTFPHGSFFEGGVNLTQLVGEVCLSSYLVETRSSTSPSAQLKDFVLGSFNTCKIEISKSCPSGQYNYATDSIDYRVEGKVTNSGFGSVTNISVVDDTNIVTNNPADIVNVTDYFATFANGDCDFDTPADPSGLLDPGQSICYRHSFNSLIAMPTDEVTATAQTTGGSPVAPATDQATCPDLGIAAGIVVSPQCSTHLVIDPAGSGKLVVEVEVSGSVCNTQESPLRNVSVYGDKADALYGDGSSSFLNNAYLAPKGVSPGECITLTSKVFYPDVLPGFPYTFGDTLTASGIASRFADTNAMCQLNNNNQIECRDVKSTSPCPLCQ